MVTVITAANLWQISYFVCCKCNCALLMVSYLYIAPWLLFRYLAFNEILLLSIENSTNLEPITSCHYNFTITQLNCFNFTLKPIISPFHEIPIHLVTACTSGIGAGTAYAMPVPLTSDPSLFSLNAGALTNLLQTTSILWHVYRVWHFGW